jgi:signal transduction histidine kinase
LNLLILEDRADDAEVMVLELADAGFDVRWERVDDEQGFVAALSADLDVILADFSLPAFDVLRALDLVRSRNLTVPLIIVSGTISEEDAVDSLKRGAADYLVKDRMARLPAAVAAAIDQRQLRDAQVRATALLETQALHLAEANAELKRADELKNQLLMMTAHELRNPLFSIMGFSDLLLTPAADEQENREAWAGVIAARARHVLRLVDDLLTFSAATLGSLEMDTVPVTAAEAIHRVASLFSPDHVTVSCPEDVMVLADVVRFEQILTNLLSNAVKYGGGNIRVEARPTQDWVEIRVSDDGPGVPDAFVPSLFETFARADHLKRSADGFGLGLAIVRSLVLAQGGDVWYEHNTPRGACFALRLPRAPVASDGLPAPRRAAVRA